MEVDVIAFHTELDARRVERRKAAELRDALELESCKGIVDDDAVLHLVVAHLDAKRMRLSSEDFAEFELWGEFEETACALFLKPFLALTWQMSKEMAAELAR